MGVGIGLDYFLSSDEVSASTCLEDAFGFIAFGLDLSLVFYLGRQFFILTFCFN